MICAQCTQEFGGDDSRCPHCGGSAALRDQPSSPAREETDFSATPADEAASFGGRPADGAASFGGRPADGAADFSTTLSVSGSTSIRGRLRPRTVGGILVESLRLYREHWKFLSLVVLVLAAPFALLQFVTQLGAGSDSHPASIWTMIPTILIEFALVKAVSDAYLGRQVTLKGVMPGSGRFGSYFMTNFIGGFAALIPLSLVAVPTVIAATSTHPSIPFVLIGGLVSVLVLLLTTIWVGIAGAAVIVEGLRGSQALLRSTNLLRGFVLRAIGVCCLQLLIGSSIAAALGVLSQVCVGDFHVGEPAVSTLVRQAFELAGTVLGTPFTLLPTVLFYYDLRIRKEGFDLQMLAQQLGYGIASQPSG